MTPEEAKANVLQRAKDAGITVKPDGKIVLPGDLKITPKKEKKVRTPRVPKSQKPFSGFSAKLHSTGRDPFKNLATGLNVIKKYLSDDSASKLSITKGQFRVALKTKKASELLEQMEADDKTVMTGEGWSVVKEYFMLKLY